MPSSGCQTCALDRKSTRLNSSHTIISYAVFCLKKEEQTAELQSHDTPAPRLPADTAPPRGVEGGACAACAVGSGFAGWFFVFCFFFFLKEPPPALFPPVPPACPLLL